MDVDFKSFRSVHYISFSSTKRPLLCLAQNSQMNFSFKKCTEIGHDENGHKYHRFIVTIVLVS